MYHSTPTPLSDACCAHHRLTTPEALTTSRSSTRSRHAVERTGGFPVLAPQNPQLLHPHPGPRSRVTTKKASCTSICALDVLHTRTTSPCIACIPWDIEQLAPTSLARRAIVTTFKTSGSKPLLDQVIRLATRPRHVQDSLLRACIPDCKNRLDTRYSFASRCLDSSTECRAASTHLASVHP